MSYGWRRFGLSCHLNVKALPRLLREHHVAIRPGGEYISLLPWIAVPGDAARMFQVHIILGVVDFSLVRDQHNVRPAVSKNGSIAKFVGNRTVEKDASWRSPRAGLSHFAWKSRKSGAISTFPTAPATAAEPLLERNNRIRAGRGIGFDADGSRSRSIAVIPADRPWFGAGNNVTWRSLTTPHDGGF
jgi:hypothetical protein